MFWQKSAKFHIISIGIYVNLRDKYNLATGRGMQASIFFAGSKPRNSEGCNRKSIRHKTLGDTRIIFALICVAAASPLVVTQ